MSRQIWIPEWLYRWLPRAAVAAGAIGVGLSGFNFALLAASMLTAGYGFCVLIVRASEWGG